VDFLVPWMHHDPKDLGLNSLVKNHEICFQILSELRIQSWIFLRNAPFTSSDRCKGNKTKSWKQHYAEIVFMHLYKTWKLLINYYGSEQTHSTASSSIDFDHFLTTTTTTTLFVPKHGIISYIGKDMAAHDCKVECNIVEYTIAFLYHDWPYFPCHGINIGQCNDCTICLPFLLQWNDTIINIQYQ